MTPKPAVLVSLLALAACATLDQPTQSNLAQYCSAENAFRLGSQSRAYLGVCPKESENAFLAGLERGRALRPAPPQVYPYYEQMQQLEKQLLAAGSEPERERLRARLREVEWWAIHIVNTPATYSVDN